MDVVTYALLKKQLGSKADLIDGKIPASELPSYVDDVIEYEDLEHFPATGEGSKIYVALDTGFTYRWSGSDYIQIGGQDLSEYYTKDETDAKLESKQDKLPETTSADEGKVLTVDNNGNLVFDEAEAGLPDVSGANVGDVLGLDSNKDPQWMTPEAGVDATQLFDAYDNTKTYKIGDLVTYNNQFYVCKTKITTAEDFNSTKWLNIFPRMQTLYMSDSLTITFTADQYALLCSPLCLLMRGNSVSGYRLFTKGNQYDTYCIYHSYYTDITNESHPPYVVNQIYDELILFRDNLTGQLQQRSFRCEFNSNNSGSSSVELRNIYAKNGILFTIPKYPVATNLAPAYSASSTYAVGDLVTYNNQLYKCNTAINVAEAWTAAHWTATSVAETIIGAINTAH